MEFTQVEVIEIAETFKQIAEKEMRDLTDLQLALVGGGIGDVTWS